MPGSITTAMCSTFKAELMNGGHCFNAIVTPTATAASAATTFTSVSTMAGVAVGMKVTGTSVGANSIVTAITTNAAFTVNVPTTAIISAAAITVTGDVFNMALIKVSPTGTYSAANGNYADITANSDEASTSTNGYTVGGQALVNTSAILGSTTAYITFNSPSWAAATFSTSGCMIYNASANPRLGGTSAGTTGGTNGSNTTGGGRACSVHDFGGNQQVSSGTFTVLMPANNSSSSILRLQ